MVMPPSLTFFPAGPSPPPSPLEQVFPPGVHSATWDWWKVLEVPQRARTEAAMNSSSQNGVQCPSARMVSTGGGEVLQGVGKCFLCFLGGQESGVGSPWGREGAELQTGGTGAWQSPGRRTQQGQTPWLS